ncbi:serine/threonine-protein kinase, partial [Planctomycetota bacterium]|nr:serine/threonine-protein kinase [Planctomycetota bacterium]
MRLVLNFTAGRHAGHSLEFESPRTMVLGRSTNADVQIHDERMSRRHCAIKVEADRALIMDMRSGNGTFCNGAPLSQVEFPLSPGDVLRMGETEITVVLRPDPNPNIPPTAPYRASAGPIPVTEPMGPGMFPAPPPPPARPAAKPVACALCQTLISPEDMARSVEHRGRFLCPGCAPRIEVPGYTIERTLGEGGMGVVYLALDHANGNAQVALKVLKSTGGFTDEDRQRFLREGTTTAGLDHPNIVRVLNRGEVPPYLYYTMEMVRGRSLKEWIAEHKTLPLISALRVSVQVGHAIEHARERHVVHRDIKPENILVQYDGLAKLADFGLAKSMLTSGYSGLTRPGDGLGTLPYMPPEQIENALYADHRSDIYSFGASIYHMLTGRPPFIGKTPLDFFNRIRSEAPPEIQSFRSDVPAILIKMIEKSLRKKPEDRYQ